MALDITTEKRRDGSYALTLAGRLDSTTAPQLEQCLKEVLQPEICRLLLDLHELDYISSMGLRLVLKARKDLEERGGKVVVARMQPPVRKVFDMAQILMKTDVFDTVKSADIYLEALQAKETVKYDDFDVP